MMGAGEAVQAAAVAALRSVPGIGAVYDRAPRRAAYPYAVVEDPIESDWGHKDGAGRELRLAAILRDGGERAARLRGLADAAETVLGALGAELTGWRIVTSHFLRRRTVPEGEGWAVVIEVRVRVLAS
jgi:hypothetical protein